MSVKRQGATSDARIIKEALTVTHPIPPIYNKSSKVLILGSFPSVKSRNEGFFYGHPQNRFWRVISEVFGEEIPRSVEEKRALLLRNGVAVWDVIASCDIIGSADSTIRNVMPNDLGVILSAADIDKIFVNGKAAEKFYIKYSKEATEKDAVCLPSTSPANAAWSIERLIAEWKRLILS